MCNHCCLGNEINITYSEHIFVAPVTKHAKRMGRIIQGVSKRALQLTGIVYLDMLQEFLIPQLDEDDQKGRIHFQQDGAPPHYLGEVREYLNTRFPGRWIGRD